MPITDYDGESLKKGAYNPDLIMSELYNLWNRNVLFPFFNILKAKTEKRNRSNIGFVVHWSFYRDNRWAVAQTPYIADAILNEFDPVVITTQQSYEYHKDHLDYLILFYPGFSAPMINIDTNKHLTAVITSDPHSDIESRNTYFVNNGIDYVLTHYYHPFKRHFPEEDYEVVHFPWSVPEEMIVDSKDISINSRKLYILGDYRSEAYETRNWCAQFPFVTDEHKDIFANKSLEDSDYYTWLRNFDAIIAANSLSDQFRYVTAKFFEIPAAGSLLFAQYSEDLNKMGFTEDNCVIFNKGNFESKAQHYINHPEDFLDRRRKGVRLISERHTISDRISTISSILGI